MNTDILPRLATVADQSTIIALINEAAEWLHSKNLDQWSKPWPTECERNERVRRGIVAGDTWIVWDGGIPAATVTTRQDGDVAMWLPEELEQPAVYVHRLVISRAYAGRRLGEHLLDWAGRQASKRYGAQTIRIDVWDTNTALHQYYERIGFQLLRVADEPWDRPSRTLFERPIQHGWWRRRGAGGGFLRRFMTRMESAGTPAGRRVEDKILH